MAYSAKVLRDSISPEGVRLTTLEVTFPRIVLAEFNTHRVFSRNSASSRAIPVEKMLKRVEEDPFIPIYWGKNQKGMQAEQELSEWDQLMAKLEWLEAKDRAVEQVQKLLELGVHKQITNRLLEPFMWHTVIVSSTEWENWRGLRRNKDAQPEIRRIADMADEAIEASTPKLVDHGEWHLPLVDDYDRLVTDGFSLTDIVKICIGRCTRVSYLTHDGKRDPRADIELCERLLRSGHMSPFEHAARPFTLYENDQATCHENPFCGNFRGWVQARKLIKDEDNFLKVLGTERPFELQGIAK